MEAVECEGNFAPNVPVNISQIAGFLFWKSSVNFSKFLFQNLPYACVTVYVISMVYIRILSFIVQHILPLMLTILDPFCSVIPSLAFYRYVKASKDFKVIMNSQKWLFRDGLVVSHSGLSQDTSVSSFVWHKLVLQLNELDIDPPLLSLYSRGRSGWDTGP